jgi:ABC-type branched-subunit amino acid transport system substrate-binding protein
MRAAPALWLSTTIFALAACQNAGDLEPIKIGLLNPTTGALADRGPARINAALLAVEQVNASGGVFDGIPLQLEVRDTGTSANRAQELALQLMDEGVAAIVGPDTSAEATAVLPLTGAKKIPLVSCCATDPKITALNQDESKGNGFFFRTTPDDTQQGRAMGFLARKLFTGPVVDTMDECAEGALLFRGDAYGSTFEPELRLTFDGQPTKSGVGARLLAAQSYPAGGNDGDIRTAVTALVQGIDGQRASLRAQHQAGATVCIFVAAFVTDGIVAVTELDDQVRNAFSDVADFKHQFIASEALQADQFAAAMVSEGIEQRLFGTSPTHAADVEGGGYARFKNAFRARFGDDDPVNFTSNNFDAIELLALALTHARRTDGTAIKESLFQVSKSGTKFEGEFFGTIADALSRDEDVDYAGPSGELDFDDDGNVVGDYVLWGVGLDGAGDPTIRETDQLPAADFTPGGR